MCGRFTISVSTDEMNSFIEEHYDIHDINVEFKLPRYNVSPSQDVISVIHDGDKYRVGMLKWGFVPFFAKDEKLGYKMINAKSETLHEKESFKHSFKTKRCVILADGFYEWKKENKEKVPMRFHLKDQSIFSIAGLYSAYTREDGSKLYTCTIITTSANAVVSTVHDRMPVILTKESETLWLNPKITDSHILSSILHPFDENLMGVYQVSPLVNSPKNESPLCIKPV